MVVQVKMDKEDHMIQIKLKLGNLDKKQLYSTKEQMDCNHSQKS